MKVPERFRTRVPRRGSALVPLLSRLGCSLRRVAAWLGVPLWLLPLPDDDTYTGASLLIAACVGVVSPALGVVILGMSVPLGRRRRAAVGRLRAQEVVAELPLAVDLLAIGLRAGATVPQALSALEGRLDGPVGEAFDRVAQSLAGGALVADALDELCAGIGEQAVALVHLLCAAMRDGDPLLVSIERLASDLHAQRRRWGEIAARRLSVQLLLPLVACVLPAFALLTVAPLAVVSLRSLPRFP